MKRKLIYSLLLAVSCFSSIARADIIEFDIQIFVDAAPNKFGSPDYAGWETDTFAAISAGSFQNMSNGSDPSNAGSTNFLIEDEVVYSFGDLGSRLTWIYWVPETDIAELTANNFEVSLVNIWDSEVTDFYDYYYGSSWITPSSWIEYNGGVIGTSGMAWWGAYNTNTQEELDSDIAEWGAVDETWIFSARTSLSDASLTSQRTAVPEPGVLALLAISLVGLRFRRRK